jgi:hypothetical protein
MLLLRQRLRLLLRLVTRHQHQHRFWIGIMVCQLNGNGNNYVAYCFAEVEGYSKFGSYTGNGSSDGPFVLLWV